ncbi:MAG: hypothetical protein HOJ06_13355 [Rhodospirillaceae bacterium]|jgi:hypothetical protein|nr:hypothetical protein [Rhodospirillaceae bacterium]MBT5811863.1 hypothetical protein [Rhodospirillaceae bacterium]
MNMQRFCVRILVVATIALIVQGCGTVIDPSVSANPSLVTAYDSNPTLPNAVKVANSLRDNFGNKVDQQIMLTRTVGLALIPVAAAAAGLGASGIGGEAILALGLAGGSAFTATTFLTSKTQQHIYAAGANAVTCALDAIHPLRVGYPQLRRLNLLLNGGIENGTTVMSYHKLIRDLDNLLLNFSGKKKSARIVRAEAAVREARDMSNRANQAIIALENAGGDLTRSLNQIKTIVRTAVIDSTPDLATLVGSLGKALPGLGQKITGATLSQGPSKTIKLSANVMITLALDLLQERTAQIGVMVEKVAVRPSKEDLKNCNADLAQAGVTFVVNPTGDIEVDVGKADATVSFTAEGGVPFYRANWVGQRPNPATVSIDDGSGLGVVTVTVKKGTPDATYTLQIKDNSNNRETRIFRIKGGGSTGGVGDSSGGVGATADPDVLKVQKFLKSKGINVNNDGIMGDATKAAIKEYLKKPETGLSPTDIADLGDDGQKLMATIKPFLPK